MYIILFIIFVLIVFVVIKSAIEIRSFRVTKYTIKSPKVEQIYRIAMLSDLHNRKYDFENLSIYGAIDDMAPNVVFIVGDMISKGEKLNVSNALPLIKKIAQKYKTIYVFGNHEQKMRDKLTDYIEELKTFGVTFLENSMIINENINIYGLEIGTEFYKRFRDKPMSEGYVESLIGKPQKDNYNILLAHNPVYFKKYANWGCDLTLSGHMHGGLINLPFVKGIVSPQLVFFPKYSSGLYQENKSKLIVGKGIGSHTFNIRVFNRPEIVFVEIIN